MRHYVVESPEYLGQVVQGGGPRRLDLEGVVKDLIVLITGGQAIQMLAAGRIAIWARVSQDPGRLLLEEDECNFIGCIAP
jgi:hypothetical protein